MPTIRCTLSCETTCRTLSEAGHPPFWHVGDEFVKRAVLTESSARPCPAGGVACSSSNAHPSFGLGGRTPWRTCRYRRICRTTSAPGLAGPDWLSTSAPAHYRPIADGRRGANVPLTLVVDEPVLDVGGHLNKKADQIAPPQGRRIGLLPACRAPARRRNKAATSASAQSYEVALIVWTGWRRR